MCKIHEKVSLWGLQFSIIAKLKKDSCPVKIHFIFSQLTVPNQPWLMDKLLHSTKQEIMASLGFVPLMDSALWTP